MKLNKIDAKYLLAIPILGFFISFFSFKVMEELFGSDSVILFPLFAIIQGCSITLTSLYFLGVIK